MGVGVLVLALICVAGVLGYMLAGWNASDAIYMVVLTIFSVGYGEVRPISDPGLRAFTIVLIVAGCSAIIYLMSGVVAMITEGRLERLLGRRRMTREIKQMEGHVILCGYGRLGRVLAAELARHAQPFVIVDDSGDRTDEASRNGYVVFQGDATSDETLRQVGVERARALATVLPNDAFNVFITLTARNLNRELLIVARGEVPATESKLTQAGADRVVLPTSIGAVQVADILLRPAVVDIPKIARSESFRQDLTHVGLDVDSWILPEASPAVGRTVREFEEAGRGRFLVAAISRSGRAFPAPEANEVLGAGDEVVVLKRQGEELRMAQVVKTRMARLRYRGAGG